MLLSACAVSYSVDRTAPKVNIESPQYLFKISFIVYYLNLFYLVIGNLFRTTQRTVFVRL